MQTRQVYAHFTKRRVNWIQLARSIAIPSFGFVFSQILALKRYRLLVDFLRGNREVEFRIFEGHKADLEWKTENLAEK
jgi:hypothetical protein